MKNRNILLLCGINHNHVIRKFGEKLLDTRIPVGIRQEAFTFAFAGGMETTPTLSVESKTLREVMHFSSKHADDVARTTEKVFDKERLLQNLKKSRLARESSKFSQHIQKEVQHRLNWMIEDAPRVEIPKAKVDRMLSVAKGNRMSPSDYLPSDYIKAHRQLFDKGDAKFQKFQPSKDWNDGIVGGKDRTSFWLSKDYADAIEKAAGRDNRTFEKLLGFDEGYLGDEPLYRLDVSSYTVAKKGIGIPTGNEDGANELWRPGGKTYPGGLPEGVMKDIGKLEGDYTWRKLN